jgi:hypothetical protein
MAITLDWNMAWTISRDGCFVASCEGHRFELGEMGRGKWILKHWASPNPRRLWYDVVSADEGKDLAYSLLKGLLS